MTAGEFINMMQDRRRYHLRRLLERAGSQRVLAAMAGMDESQLSNILAGRLAFTEFRARKVEQFMGLEFGEMDRGNHGIATDGHHE